MTQSLLEFKVVPFSKHTIKEHNLHLVDDDELGESTILLLLDGLVKSRFPRKMVVCLTKGTPIGVGLVFIVKPAETFLSNSDQHDHEPHGFLNVYVKRAVRHRGIGGKLIELAMHNFQSTYTGINRVFVSHVLKNAFPNFRGIEPVFANTRQSGTATFLKSVLRRYKVQEVNSHRPAGSRHSRPIDAVML